MVQGIDTDDEDSSDPFWFLHFPHLKCEMYSQVFSLTAENLVSNNSKLQEN